jgi:hypothetical protein
MHRIPLAIASLSRGPTVCAAGPAYPYFTSIIFRVKVIWPATIR